MRRAVLVLLVAAACGDDAKSTPDSQVAIDAPDGQSDAAPDGMDPPVCGAAGPAEMMCGTECVDTSSDKDHCGSCTMTCANACASSTCVASLTTSWEHHFGGAEFGNEVEGVTVDGAGNTYVTGMFTGTIDLGGGPLVSAGATDIFIASFAPDGTYRWAKRFGDAMGDQGVVLTIAGGTLYAGVVFAGTVDFGGGAHTSTGSSQIALLELGPATGAYVNAFVISGPGDDAPLGLVVDASGNITIGGFFGPGMLDFGGGHTLAGAGVLNAFVASITSTGAYRWARRLSGPTTTTISSCQSLAIDGAGNVTCGGILQESTDFGGGTVTAKGSDAYLASYTSAGTYRWARVLGQTQSDSADSVAADANGNILSAGLFHGTVDFGNSISLTQTGVADGWFAVFDGATGATRWAKHIGADSSGGIRDVAFDAAGNAVVAGDVEGDLDLGTGALAPLGEYDILVAGFDKTTGATQFAKRYGGTDFEEGDSLSVTTGGNVVVGGFFRGTVDLGTGSIAGGPDDNGYVMLIAR